MFKIWQRTKIKLEKVEGDISRELDLTLLIASFLIIAIGLLSIYSSTYNISYLHVNFYKQLVFAVIGLFLGLIVYNLPLKVFNLVATPFYIFLFFY